jgi:uroporphyrin-III C-methyltransferase
MTYETPEIQPAKLPPVRLVGAGPGAPDLITVRGARALAKAQVVLYDDLASAELLDLCPVAAERVYVGKRAGKHSASQETICELLVAKGRTGQRVVRLKGGDPMIFGRAGEEITALVEAGLDFEIVPGVTAAAAAGAAGAIPLTQRGITSTMVFVTGHDCADRATPVNWRTLASLNATLCIYMGTRRFGIIADELIAGGLPAETSVALISGATLTSQHVRIGTLADRDQLTSDPKLTPALIIVGEVVRWSELAVAARQLAAAP